MNGERDETIGDEAWEFLGFVSRSGRFLEYFSFKDFPFLLLGRCGNRTE